MAGILTRAARKSAGLPPPTPLFKCTIKSEKEEQCPSVDKVDDSPSSSSTSSSGEDGERTRKYASTTNKRQRRSKVLWVQCDNRSCRKWRRLPSDTHIDVDQLWYCHMHPDTGQNSCDIPEEKYIVSRKRGFIFSRLEVGQLVWAKMAGFCPWPGVVTSDPWGDSHICEEREGCIYHVEFLGRDHTHNWLVEDKVEPYYGSEYKPHLGALKNTKTLLRAEEEADLLLKLTPGERLKKCVFQKNNNDVRSLSRSTVTAKTESISHQKYVKRGPGRPAAKSSSAKPKRSAAGTNPGVSTSTSATSVGVPEIAGQSQSTSTAGRAKMTSAAGERAVGQHSVSTLQLNTVGASIQLLLQSLGISLHSDTVKKCMEAATENTSSLPLNSSSSRKPLTPVISNKLKATVPPLSQQCMKETSRGSGIATLSSKPTTYQYSSGNYSRGSKRDGCLTTESAKMKGRGRGRGGGGGGGGGGEGRGRGGGGGGRGKGMWRGRRRGGTKHNASKTEQMPASISPSIMDYFQPTISPHQQQERTNFHQLACEAEGELKEMEEILALLPPPSPPPLSPPPPPHTPATSVTTTDTFLGKAVDSSIACVLNEMTEIEGLLQDLDSAQLVPYIDQSLPHSHTAQP